MKDSGVEWIGEIPKDWGIVQVKYLFKIGRGRVIAQTELDDNGMYPVFSSQTQNEGCLGYINTYDFDMTQLTWTTDGVNAGTVFLRCGKHNCTNICGTLQPISSSFDLHYQKYALEYIAFYHKRADTNGYKIMNNEMARIHTIIPPLVEQYDISNFLDKKCRKIDFIIAKQKEIIQKLKEYKMSFINESINNDIGTKCHLGYVGTMKNGLNFSSALEGIKIKFLGVGDFQDNFILDKLDMFSDIITMDEISEEYMLRDGDIIFVRSNGSKELVGRAVMVKNINYPLTYSGFCIRFRNEKMDIIDSNYLLYFFRSFDFRKQLEKNSQGSNINNVNQELLSQINVTFPDIELQRKVVHVLDEKCKEIDDIICNKTRLIDKFLDYRKSVIYEVVTGKKEMALI